MDDCSCPLVRDAWRPVCDRPDGVEFMCNVFWTGRLIVGSLYVSLSYIHALCVADNICERPYETSPLRLGGNNGRTGV